MAKKAVSGLDRFQEVKIRVDILQAAYDAAKTQLEWHYMNYIKDEETGEYDYEIDPERQIEYETAKAVLKEIEDLL